MVHIELADKEVARNGVVVDGEEEGAEVAADSADGKEAEGQVRLNTSFTESDLNFAVILS